MNRAADILLILAAIGALLYGAWEFVSMIEGMLR